MAEPYAIRGVFEDQISPKLNDLLGNMESIKELTENLNSEEIRDMGFAHQLKVSNQATQAMAEFRAEVATGATVVNEYRARMQVALDTFVEFGASADQVARAHQMMEQANASGARGLAQTSNVLRTLVDESEDAAEALNSVEQAQRLKTKASLKLEDAGRQVGASLRGETDALRSLRGASARAASVIDNVTDAQLRQRLVAQELERGLSGQTGTVDRLTNALAPMNVELARMGLPTVTATGAIAGLTGGLAALGTAAVATAAAVAKLNFDALAKYEQSVPNATHITRDFSQALEDLEINVGAVSAANGNILTRSYTAVTDAIDSASSSVGLLGKAFEQANDPVKRQETILLDLTGQLSFTEQAAFTYANAERKLQEAVFGSTTAQEQAARALGDKRAAVLAEEEATVKAYEATLLFGDANEDAATSAALLGSRLQQLSREMVDPIGPTKALTRELETLTGVAAEWEALKQSNPELGGNLAKSLRSQGIKLTSDGTGIALPKSRKGSGGGRKKKKKSFIDDLSEGLDEREKSRRSAVDIGSAFVNESKKEREALEKRLNKTSHSRFQARLGELATENQANRPDTVEALQTVKEARAEFDAILDQQNELRAVGTNTFSALTEGVMGLTVALGDGSLAFKDLGQAATGVLSSVLVDSGRQLAMFAIKKGAIFKLLGNAYATLATNPLAAAGVGVALIAAGAALNRFTNQGSSGGRGSFGGGGRDAGQAIEQFGRRLFERQSPTSGGMTVLRIGDREFRAYQQEVSQDLLDRGGLDLTRPLALQAGR